MIKIFLKFTVFRTLRLIPATIKKIQIPNSDSKLEIFLNFPTVQVQGCTLHSPQPKIPKLISAGDIMFSFFLGMDPALTHLDLNPRYKLSDSMTLSAGKLPNKFILIILRTDENAIKVTPKLLLIPHFR